ncbi:MAG: hypothetical protein HC899_37530 [Leptolyngbyaceae cyanobacterium SM1_4_3]|nr:hypothetical protein [Leptolyngbyaceae cyanobacterium SM1_4_3]
MIGSSFRSDLDAASLINEAFVVRQIDGGIRVAAFGFTQEYLGNAPQFRQMAAMATTSSI